MQVVLLAFLFMTLIGSTCKNTNKPAKIAQQPPADSSKDVLVSFRHPDYGFYITYSQKYHAEIDNRNHRIITLSIGSAHVLMAYVDRIPSDLWHIKDSLKTNPDTLLVYAVAESRNIVALAGEYSTASARVDSVKSFITARERRAFAVYISFIEDRWDEIDDQHPAHKEMSLDPVYWVDISTDTLRTLLRITTITNFSAYTPGNEEFLSSFANLVFVP